MDRLIRLTHLATILFLFSGETYGQYEFKSDKHYLPHKSRLLDIAGLETFDSKNLFEMRVWIGQSMNPSSLCRYVLQNDSTWYAEKYSFSVKRKGMSFEKDSIDLGREWKVVMDTLVELGVLILLDWMEIRDNCKGKMQVTDGDTIYRKCVVADGTGYTIELLTDHAKRRYSYHCPKTYRDFYADVPELDSIVRILEILFNSINYGHVYCRNDGILPATLQNTY